MEKKVLLLAVAMMATSVSFAQSVRSSFEDALLSKSKANKGMIMQQAVANDGVKTAGPRRSYSDGFYFSKPAGSMYYNWDLGGGYGPSFLIVSPYDEMVFTDESSSKETNMWYLFGGTDITDYKDADYNLNLGYLSPGYMYPGVYMTSEDGSQVDSLCVNNYYLPTYPSYYARIYCDSIHTLGFLDDHTGAYGWGALDNAYLFGTGTRTYSDGTVATCYGVYQEYPEPMSPLYVESVECKIYCDASTPLSNGATLTMTIYNAETSEVIKTLTATADDVVGMERYGSHNGYLTGEYYGGYVVFADKATDPFGNEYYNPFTIDCPTAVAITGFDQDGANVCITGVEIQSEDYADFTDAEGAIKQGYALAYYTDSNGEQQTTSIRYISPIALNMTFRGVMDKVLVAKTMYDTNDNAYEDCNVLKVAAEGGTAAAESTGAEYAYVMTAMDWFDEDGNEMYYPTEELPDWLQMEATASYDETYGSYTGETYLTFVADELPDGVTGRSALITIEGRGTTADNVIEILQGDATSGINVVEKTNTTSNSALYNLSGQRVSKDAKGLLIRNGKKFIVK